MFEAFSLNVPPARQKLFQNFTSLCNASIKVYESTPPDFSKLSHFLLKIKPDDSSISLLLGGVGRV